MIGRVKVSSGYSPPIILIGGSASSRSLVMNCIQEFVNVFKANCGLPIVTVSSHGVCRVVLALNYRNVENADKRPYSLGWTLSSCSSAYTIPDVVTGH